MPTSSRDGSPSSQPTHRIAKLLARAGVASRREIERMIEDGRVALNGKILDTPATVLPDLTGVTVDGNPVAEAEPTRLFLFHKPTGVLTTEYDPKGRPTIYDRLPKGLPRLIPVGRLDYNTEGLLLMTTDGGLKRQLELPATGVERAYRARAYGQVSQPQLEDLMEGIEIDGIRYGSIDANIERRTGANVWVEMILKEGKNREVRRVLEHLGLEVSRLIRTRYGPFVLGDLQPGQIGEVRRHDVESFRAEPTRKELPQPSRKSAVTTVAPPPDATPKAEPEGRLRTAKPKRAPAAKNEPRRRADGSLATRGTGGRSERTRSFREQRGEEERPARAPSERPARARSAESRPPRGDGPRSDRPRADRAARADRPTGDRVRSERPNRAPTDRSPSDRPRPDRAGSDRPRTPRAGPSGPRSGGARPTGPRKPGGPKRPGGGYR